MITKALTCPSFPASAFTNLPVSRRDNPPAGRLQTPIHARLALHQAEVDHASAQAGRVWVAALQ